MSTLLLYDDVISDIIDAIFITSLNYYFFLQNE